MNPCPEMGIWVLSSPIITVGCLRLSKKVTDSKRLSDEDICAEAPLSMTMRVIDVGNDGCCGSGVVGA